MKKVLLMASIMMSSLCAFAQREVGLWTIQPKAGLNIADITDSDMDSRVAFAAGVELEYQITDLYSISLGMLYSMQGAKDTYKTSGTNAKATLKADYINIPIMLNCYVTENFAVKLGIQPSFNVKSDFDVSVKGYSFRGNMSDMGLDMKSFDFAIPVGMSYEYKNFVFDCRYNYGVVNLFDEDESHSRNSVFQFTLGYKFSL